MKRGFAAIETFVVLAIICICAAILFPILSHARENARKASCQANQKRLVLALQHYSADYNGYLPVQKWVAPLTPYAKPATIFHCPSQRAQTNSDYFFNARFLKTELGSIEYPQTLILLGDGQGKTTSGDTLSKLPATWRTDQTSPTFRHLSGANYGFADGHVKWFKSENVSNNFRMVQP